MTLTAEILRSVVDYDPETGWFTSKAPGKRFGRRVGNTRKNGYRFVWVKGKFYQEHRLAWLHVHGHWPRLEIDHINRCPADNRLANLRDVSASENQRNKPRYRQGRRDGSGATFIKRTNRWQSCVYNYQAGRVQYVGLFLTREDAVAAAARYRAEIDL